MLLLGEQCLELSVQSEITKELVCFFPPQKALADSEALPYLVGFQLALPG